MDKAQLTHPPQSKTAMLIRRPVAEVFDAFINPNITTKFWWLNRISWGQNHTR